MATLVEIRARREHLIAEAARQREVLAHRYSCLRGPAATVGRGLDALGWLRRHPLVLGAAAAVLVVVRPRRALKVAAQGLFLWRSVQTIRGLLRGTGLSL